MAEKEAQKGHDREERRMVQAGYTRSGRMQTTAWLYSIVYAVNREGALGKARTTTKPAANIDSAGRSCEFRIFTVHIRALDLSCATDVLSATMRVVP